MSESKNYLHSVSFWVSPRNEEGERSFVLKKRLNDMIKDSYESIKSRRLINNALFPIPKKNIFIVNIPINFNYNKKKNFISVELYMHTVNVLGVNKVPYRCEAGNPLYDEASAIANELASMDVFCNNSSFLIAKTN